MITLARRLLHEFFVRKRIIELVSRTKSIQSENRICEITLSPILMVNRVENIMNQSDLLRSFKRFFYAEAQLTKIHLPLPLV